MSKRYPKVQKVLRDKVITLFRRHYIPRWIVFTMDSFAVFLTFSLAYLLPFNFKTADFAFNMAFQQALIAVCIYVLFAFVFGPYSGLIRHTTVIDIFNVFLSPSFSMGLYCVSPLQADDSVGVKY